ncbi:hypothetical protein [Rossellomorea vietnamensis]|uniref:Uncharacterized protein n=1 Tax=Rossellomorea vietnamensis TaxID=218284 RepID=A0A0P6W3D1_9BACI|nr:hypothetical protein [Rossellomorea vietnamensis]KPL59926.1 hypothetical protein AM506_07545 [Rossellomorea vietnamensis]
MIRNNKQIRAEDYNVIMLSGLSLNKNSPFSHFILMMQEENECSDKREVRTMWIRIIPILFFSFTAITLMTYQGIEIFHALNDFIFNKSKLK